MKLNSKIFIISFLCIVAFLFLVFLNLQSSILIEKTYLDKNFKLLNKLAQTSGELSLDYYQGRISDRFVGPLTNVLSHLILVSMCFMFSQKLTYRRFVALIFLFLVISKVNILFYPPYGDAVGGPFAEALWLKDHNFDYVGLFHQPGYLEGGAKVYFFTVYPMYLAILYKLIPSVELFLVVNHLLVYAMAAVVVAVSREILMKSLEPLTATLGSLVVLALPLFQSQTEAINMEMPQLFLSALSVWAIIRGDILKATMWAILALSVKGHGVIICGTVFLYSMYLFFADDKRRYDWRILGWGTIALIFAFLNLGSKFLLKDQHVSQGMVKLFVGWVSLKTMCLPALLEGTVVLLGIYVLGVIWMVKMGQKTKSFSQMTAQRSLSTQLIVLLMCVMWFGLFLNFKAVSPRYKLALQPFLVMSIIFSLTNFEIIRRAAKPLIIVAIIIITIGSFGMYYRPLEANYHVLSERSLEYRNNVKMDVKVCQFLEKNFQAFTIGAPFIFAQMLNVPEFGYVKSPLNVVQYGLPIHYRTIKSFEGLDKLDIMKTIWVGVPADKQMLGEITYPIHPKDKVIKEFILGDNKVTLFMGGFSIDYRLKMVQQFMLHRQLQRN